MKEEVYMDKDKDRGAKEYGKERYSPMEEYGKERVPKTPAENKMTFAKTSAQSTEVRQKTPQKTQQAAPIQQTQTLAAAQQPRPQSARPQTVATQAASRPRKRIYISWPFVLGIFGGLAVLALVICSIIFWSFGQWTFGVLLSAGLIAGTVLIYLDSDYYIPQMWIAGILAVLSVILVFLLKDKYDTMAMLLALGFAVIFFLCTHYAQEDGEEGPATLSAILMACNILVATGVLGGFTLLWFFACFLPGMLIVTIVACALTDFDDVFLFGNMIGGGIMQAAIVAASTLLIHLLFELICSFFK